MSGHRFHTVIMLSHRVQLAAQGADRDRYHHVMGWANLVVPGLEGLLELRNLTWTRSTRAIARGRCRRWVYSPPPAAGRS